MQRTRSQALVQTNQKGAVKLPAHVPAGRAALTCWRARSAAACPPTTRLQSNVLHWGVTPSRPRWPRRSLRLPGALSPGGDSPCPPGAGPPGQHPPQNCQSALAGRAVTSHKSLSGT